MAKTKQIAKTGEVSALAKVRTGSAWFLQDLPEPILSYEPPVTYASGSTYPAQLLLTLNTDTAFAVSGEERLPDGRFKSKRIPSAMAAAAAAAGMKPLMFGDTAESEWKRRPTTGPESLLGVDLSRQETYVSPLREGHVKTVKIETIHPGSPLGVNGKIPRYAPVPELPLQEVSEDESTAIDLTNTKIGKMAKDLRKWFLFPIDLRPDGTLNMPIFGGGMEGILNYVETKAQKHEAARLAMSREDRKNIPAGAEVYFYVAQYVTEARQLMGTVIRTRLPPLNMPEAGEFRGRLPVVFHAPFWVRRVLPVAPVQVTPNLYVEAAEAILVNQEADDQIRKVIASRLARILLSWVSQPRILQQPDEDGDAQEDSLWEKIDVVNDPERRAGYDAPDLTAPVHLSSKLMSAARKMQRRILRTLDAQIAEKKLDPFLGLSGKGRSPEFSRGTLKDAKTGRPTLNLWEYEYGNLKVFSQRTGQQVAALYKRGGEVTKLELPEGEYTIRIVSTLSEVGNVAAGQVQAPLMSLLSTLAFEVSRQLPAALQSGFEDGEFDAAASPASSIEGSGPERDLLLYRQAMEFVELLSLATTPMGGGTASRAHVCGVCGAEVAVARGTNLAVTHTRKLRQDEVRKDRDKLPTCEGSGQSTTERVLAKVRQYFELKFAQRGIWPAPNQPPGSTLKQRAMLAYRQSPELQGYIEDLRVKALTQWLRESDPLYAFRIFTEPTR